MKPISPIALILWYYQQGSQLSAKERSQLLQWTEQSEERRVLLGELIYQNKWLKLTLMQFLKEFEHTISRFKSGIITSH